MAERLENCDKLLPCGCGVHRYRLCRALAAGGALVAQGGRGQGGRGGAPRVEIKDGEECPPGMVEVRANSCQAPVTRRRRASSTTARVRPSSPKATLVPKAKFPVVDVHTHGTSSVASIAERIKEMDALNLRVLVDLSGGSDPPR